MTSEEAITILKDLWRYEHTEYTDKEVRNALDMAMKALEQEPKIGGDCISRSAVVKIMHKLWSTSGEFLDEIMDMPSVIPKEPTETKKEILSGISKELTRLAINYFNISLEFNDYLKALNDVQDYIDKIKGE